MDKEYIILEKINENQNISQRQLAQKTGLSLGSINILLKKMIKEGLIKVENIPANRVAYMLTPKGMVEKANKTYTYIKHHYTVIHETKEKIKNVLYNQLEELQDEEKLYIVFKDDEISQLTKTSITELELHFKENIISIDEKMNQLKYNKGLLIVSNDRDYEKYQSLGYRVMNILEKL
ncbi:Winged helix-turn-helix DNA-binding [Anaerovirgula multivorans]|uniref:Winged helix-turn-helix DNA-binding n=1 Tax=Anaerovirgula multivorans TaxID=312168 RepID=A0A239EGI5_9FIRM|nr:winged helix-turn-helix transcriptional regulator [Anaerovirgula multivorans]SNS43747.1 Winged helix-turn-helix DNA-binding [Anaerovirgula multivorans]